MNSKFLLFFLLCFSIFLDACQKEEVELTPIERFKLAQHEVILYYHSDEAKIESYKELVNKVNQISKKYDVKITPLTYSSFTSYYLSKQAGKILVAEDPCSGFGWYLVTSTEWVDEGNGYWGFVVHFGNGKSILYSFYDIGGALIEYDMECFS